MQYAIFIRSLCIDYFATKSKIQTDIGGLQLDIFRELDTRRSR